MKCIESPGLSDNTLTTLPAISAHSRLPALSSDLNRLVMDYLVLEGYQAAAEEFSKEANVSPLVDFSSIETRMTIREAVQRGDVEEAIELVNDLNPEVRNTLLIPHHQTLQLRDGHTIHNRYLERTGFWPLTTSAHVYRLSLGPCVDLTALLHFPYMFTRLT